MQNKVPLLDFKVVLQANFTKSSKDEKHALHSKNTIRNLMTQSSRLKRDATPKTDRPYVSQNTTSSPSQRIRQTVSIHQKLYDKNPSVQLQHLSSTKRAVSESNSSSLFGEHPNFSNWSTQSEHPRQLTSSSFYKRIAQNSEVNRTSQQKHEQSLCFQALPARKRMKTENAASMEQLSKQQQPQQSMKVSEQTRLLSLNSSNYSFTSERFGNSSKVFRITESQTAFQPTQLRQQQQQLQIAKKTNITNNMMAFDFYDFSKTRSSLLSKNSRLKTHQSNGQPQSQLSHFARDYILTEPNNPEPIELSEISASRSSSPLSPFVQQSVYCSPLKLHLVPQEEEDYSPHAKQYQHSPRPLHQNFLNDRRTTSQFQDSSSLGITPKQIEMLCNFESQEKKLKKREEIFKLVKQLEENILDSSLSKKQSETNELQESLANSNPFNSGQQKMEMKRVEGKINDEGVGGTKRKAYSRMSLIRQIVNSKSKQSIAVIHDILRINNISPRDCNESEETTEDKVNENRKNQSKNQLNVKLTISSDKNDSAPQVTQNHQLNEKQKDKGYLLRNALKDALLFLKRIAVSPKDLVQCSVFSQRAFEKKGSRQLISAAKSGDILALKDLLHDDKFLVYDFDYMFLTALHWAVKRGNEAAARILISFGANFEAKDIVGRTPLYFAILNNDFNIAQLLLSSRASPWSTGQYDLKDLSKDNPKIQSLLSKFRKLFIITSMCKPSTREVFWKKHALSSMESTLL